MEAAAEEVVLDNYGCGSASIKFLQNGSFAIDRIEGRGKYSVTVFDKAGKFVASKASGASYASGPLKAGEYHVVVMERTPLLGSVSHMDRLKECGLAKRTGAGACPSAW